MLVNKDRQKQEHLLNCTIGIGFPNEPDLLEKTFEEKKLIVKGMDLVANYRLRQALSVLKMYDHAQQNTPCNSVVERIRLKIHAFTKKMRWNKKDDVH